MTSIIKTVRDGYREIDPASMHRGGGACQQRAIYTALENPFEFAWPAVPRRQFLEERDEAFATETPTGLIPLDTSDALEVPHLATTPTILARYVRLRSGDSLRSRFKASGEVYYVMHGQGCSKNGADFIWWQTGDLFCFPGG